MSLEFIDNLSLEFLKYIRWLRNFFYRELPWSKAVARLRKVYLVF